MKRLLSKIMVLFTFIFLGLGFYFLYTSYFKFTGNLEDLIGNGQLILDYSNLEDSKYTGEGISVDTKYHPYYGLLNSNEQKLYRQVYDNLNNFNTTFVPRSEIDINSVDRVIEAVMNDNPELFYVNNKYTYKYTNDNICRQIIMEFNGLEKDYTSNKNSIDKTVNEIIKGSYKYSSNYDKEKYVHDFLIDRLVYDTNFNYNQTIYSSLFNNKTVCAGYARAFQYIMNKIGIPTYYVTGTSKGESHAWNIVYLGDGYYNVDVTWDDVYNRSYNYFNLTDKSFSNSHTRNSLSIYLPKCNSTNNSYEKPVKVVPPVKNKKIEEEPIIEEEKETEEEIIDEKIDEDEPAIEEKEEENIE